MAGMAGTRGFASSSVVGAPRRASAVSARRGRRHGGVMVRADKCLIANTKGGGHAFIGYHLAKKLVSAGHTVTILNDGDQAKLESKQPFDQYASLDGVSVIYGDPANPAAALGGESFDVVIDNNGKDLDTCAPLIDMFKGSAKQYMFVSSAGMYIPGPVEPEYVEGDEVKASAGHNAVETYLKESGAAYTIFRPLYIYGPYTAKPAYFDYYIDRISRDKPVPVPSPGVQLTSLTHVEDVASMMAAAVGNAAAAKQTFNMCTDRYVTLEGVARLVAKQLGKEAKVVHYDPKKAAKGEGVPMRAVHFFCSAEKAKRDLGWAPAHLLEQDVKEVCEDYETRGRASAEVDLTADEKIVAAVA